MWWIQSKVYKQHILKRLVPARKVLLMSAVAVGLEALLLLITIHTLPGVLITLARALPALPSLLMERGPGIVFSFLILLVQVMIWPALFVFGARQSMMLLLRLRREWLEP